MKMAIVAYNEAIEDEVMEIFHGCALTGYTKMDGVFGKGVASGTHLGTDIWPGRNSMLLVVGEDASVKQLLSRVRELRKSLGREGVKAFVVPVEEMT